MTQAEISYATRKQKENVQLKIFFPSYYKKLTDIHF